MRSKLFRLLAVVAVMALTAAPVTAQPVLGSPVAVPGAVPVVAGGPGDDLRVTTAADGHLARFDDDLQTLAKTGGDDTVWIRVVSTADAQPADWAGLAQLVKRAVPDESSGLPVWYGQARASNLGKLASLPALVLATHVSDVGQVPRFRDPDMDPPRPSEERIAQMRAAAANPPAGGAGPNVVDGWWDVGPGHESRAAWEKGWTGDGVKVADIDSGVDFCHPDLFGTWAVYDVDASYNRDYEVFTPYPYQAVEVLDYYDYFDGWPMALSPVSNLALFFDIAFNGAPTEVNTFAEGFTKFADTRATGTGDTFTFDGKVYTTTGTADIFNPVYHIGYHPDTSLRDLVWGEQVAVLVVDETGGDGVYETVYVDLNNNHDFSDDAPTSQESPTACWDYDGDGYYDVSGGLVYFIADGLHWPPMMDWWFDPSFFGFPVMGSGEMVAFMFDDVLGPAAAHGTSVAGNIVGQGVIDGDPAAFGGESRPAWKPTGVGGMVQGGGRDAELVAIGDIYQLFEVSTEDAWYFSAYGLDGYGDSDDGVQIASNSFGESEVDNDEWDQRSRLITRINTNPDDLFGFDNDTGQSLAFLVSTGNGGSGYGTITSADASTAIDVGASTQFGSTNGLDIVAGPGQVVWGEVVSFSNRGPTAMGHAGPDITGDGAFAAGAVTLNSWLDGWSAWNTWGGTSRSTPVVAGNLALVYQAWRDRTGSWPTWAEAKELLANSAEDQSYDTLTQGSGSVNADYATDIAAGDYGVHISPSEWYPGDFEGNDYLSFAHIMEPGDTDGDGFSLQNYGAEDITVGITATQLTRTGEFTFTVTTDDVMESPYLVTRPDYLFDVSEYAPGGIPAGTDLMMAEVINPFDQFEPQDDSNPANNSVWRVLWYSHVDLNGNGRVWQDTNANGAVNTGEIDLLEYVRMNYGYSSHTYKQVTVRDPLSESQWKDGIYLGLQHRTRTPLVPSTNLTIRVSFYERTAWDWVSLSDETLLIPAGSGDGFGASLTVPGDAPYGIYDGEIQVSLPGDGDDAARTSIIPVVVNVAFEGDLTADPVILGGTERGDQMYDNGHVTGPQDWTWRKESGDWRFYFLNQTEMLLEGTKLIVRDEWGDSAPNTDLDTLVFGPALGSYASGSSFFCCVDDFSDDDPATFGPYTLEPIGGSEDAYLGSGIWDFDTTSGGNVDYVAADLTTGLHEVANRTTRFEGNVFDVPFTKTVSTLNLESAALGFTDTLHYANLFSDALSVTTNITHTEGLTVSAFGTRPFGETLVNEPITQDPTNDDPCDYGAGGVYTYTVTVGPNVESLTAYVAVGSNDLDLFMAYDFDDDGPDCPGDLFAASTNGSGEDDFITVEFPPEGTYLVIIQGWDVPGGASTFDWFWEQIELTDTIQVDTLDLELGPEHPATFRLFNTAENCDAAIGECQDGVLLLGFPDAPGLIRVPITVDYTQANLEGSSKTVNTATALVGDVLTYTVTISNSSVLSDAVGVMVTDTLPAGTSFWANISGAAVYSPTLGAMLWSGDVPADSTETFVYEVTVDEDVHHGTVIQNFATVDNGAGGIIEVGPAETTVGSIDLSGSTKSVDKEEAAGGETLLYVVSVDNGGEVAAAGALVTDTLPANTTYVEASATNGAVYSPTLNAMLWTGPVEALDSDKFQYEVVLDAPLDAGTVITNTATVDTGFGDLTTTNVVTTTIVAGVLDLSTKTASAAFVQVGDTVTFTVHLVNSGEIATNVTVTDTLPAGLTLVPGSAEVAAGGPGSVIETGNGISYAGTLDAEFESEALIRYAATVDGDVELCENLSNTAYITDDQGHTLTRSATVTTNCHLIWFPSFRW